MQLLTWPTGLAVGAILLLVAGCVGDDCETHVLAATWHVDGAYLRMPSAGKVKSDSANPEVELPGSGLELGEASVAEVTWHPGSGVLFVFNPALKQLNGGYVGGSAVGQGRRAVFANSVPPIDQAEAFLKRIAPGAPDHHAKAEAWMASVSPCADRCPGGFSRMGEELSAGPFDLPRLHESLNASSVPMPGHYVRGNSWGDEVVTQEMEGGWSFTWEVYVRDVSISENGFETGIRVEFGDSVSAQVLSEAGAPQLTTDLFLSHVVPLAERYGITVHASDVQPTRPAPACYA